MLLNQDQDLLADLSIAICSSFGSLNGPLVQKLAPIQFTKAVFNNRSAGGVETDDWFNQATATV